METPAQWIFQKVTSSNVGHGSVGVTPRGIHVPHRGVNVDSVLSGRTQTLSKDLHAPDFVRQTHGAVFSSEPAKGGARAPGAPDAMQSTRDRIPVLSREPGASFIPLTFNPAITMQIQNRGIVFPEAQRGGLMTGLMATDAAK